MNREQCRANMTVYYTKGGSNVETVSLRTLATWIKEEMEEMEQEKLASLFPAKGES